MEYQYKKALEKYGLTESELSEDAKAGIAQLNSINRTIAANEASGKKLSSATIKKINALDKWIVYEIVDQVEETDANDNEPEFSPEEIQARVEADLAKTEADKKTKGELVETELAKLFNEGAEKTISLENLQTKCPVCYDIIFNNYDENGDNGVETTRYSLIETAEQIFTISKK